VRRLLSSEAERQLTQARELLASLRDALIRFGASSADEATLARSIRQLDEFFLLVVVGEFNAGKSAFINALLGQAGAAGRCHADHRPHPPARARSVNDRATCRRWRSRC
jgi:ribosome biogenesis GTPase A